MNLSSPSLKPLSVCTAFGGSMLCQEFCFAFTCGLSNPCSLAASSPSPFWSVLTHPEQLHFSTLCGPQPQFSSHAHLWGSTPFLTCYSEYTHSDHNLFSLITVSWGLPPCLPVGLSMISTFGTFSPFLSSLHAVFCSTNILGDSWRFTQFLVHFLSFGVSVPIPKVSLCQFPTLCSLVESVLTQGVYTCAPAQLSICSMGRATPDICSANPCSSISLSN